MQFAIICKRIDNSSFQLHKECFGNFNGWIYSIKTNPKYFFSYAKQFSTTHSKIGPLLNKLNEYTSNSSEMGEILSSQYASVFSEPSPSPYHSMIDDPDIPAISEIDFTEEDIIAAIDELSNTSASGPDGLTAIFLKNVHFH